jgi:uncharacterized protein YutE (UPF0331/DUF86 family)
MHPNDLNAIRTVLAQNPSIVFRNSLVHRYWIIDDETLIENIKGGVDDFDRFADEMESYARSIQK